MKEYKPNLEEITKQGGKNIAKNFGVGLLEGVKMGTSPFWIPTYSRISKDKNNGKEKFTEMLTTGTYAGNVGKVVGCGLGIIANVAAMDIFYPAIITPIAITNGISYLYEGYRKDHNGYV